MNLFLYMYLFTALACNHEIQHLIIIIFLNWLLVVKKKDFGFGSGLGSKFNCAARVGSGRVGSDDLGYRSGSGFSLKPVQTSTRLWVLMASRAVCSEHAHSS